MNTTTHGFQHLNTAIQNWRDTRTSSAGSTQKQAVAKLREFDVNKQPRFPECHSHELAQLFCTMARNRPFCSISSREIAWNCRISNIFVPYTFTSLSTLSFKKSRVEGSLMLSNIEHKGTVRGQRGEQRAEVCKSPALWVNGTAVIETLHYTTPALSVVLPNWQRYKKILEKPEKKLHKSH